MKDTGIVDKREIILLIINQRLPWLPKGIVAYHMDRELILVYNICV